MFNSDCVSFEGTTSSGIQWKSYSRNRQSFLYDGIVPLKDKLEALAECNASWEAWEKEIVPKCIDTAITNFFNQLDLTDLDLELRAENIEDIRSKIKDSIIKEKKRASAGSSVYLLCTLTHMFDYLMRQSGISDEYQRELYTRQNLDILYDKAAKKADSW